MYLPECFDSIISESDNRIFPANSFCICCFTRLPISKVIDLAKYREIPFVENATIIKIGIKTP